MINRGDLTKYALLPELAAAGLGATGGIMFANTRLKPYSKRYHPKVIGRMYNMEHHRMHGRETGIDDEELGKQIQHQQSEYDGSPHSAIDRGLGWGLGAGIGAAGAALLTSAYRSI